jgi:hypothetical protein
MCYTHELSLSNVVANKMHQVIQYLRDMAHRCVRLARNCRDDQTADELEDMSVEIMEKASELDAHFR